MKFFLTSLILFRAMMPAVFGRQLEIVSNAPPQKVFFGNAKKIAVNFHNVSGQIFDDEIRARLFQTTSTMAVELSKTNWKKLEVLPGQTVIESAQLNFPAVNAETKFLVQWLESSNVLGATEVFVYPTNLLLELKPLVGDKMIGVFDPQNELKPLLKNLQIDFDDLENLGVTNFFGRLAIVGAFAVRGQEPDDLTQQIKALVKKNTAIVWIQSPEKKSEKFQPSFYSVPEKQIAIVVVQPDLISDLADNPQSQLNLLHFCKLALKPQPPALPDFSQ